MKLLLENWRRFLNERKSDIQYQKITDFFLYLIQEGSLWEGFKNRASEYYKPDRSGRPGYMFKLIKGGADESLFAKYREMTGDEDIISNFEIFKIVFGQFKILVIPELGLYGAFGAPKNLPEKKWGFATVTLNADYVVPGAAGSRGEGVTKETQKAYNESEPEKIFKYVQEASPYIRRIINHELTHYLNLVRAEFGNVRGSATITRSHNPGDIESANSTEEVQARMIAAIKIFKDASDEYKSGSFMKMSPQEFLKLFIAYYNEPVDPQWTERQKRRATNMWDPMEPKLKKKVIARIFDTENGVFVNLKRQWEKDNPDKGAGVRAGAARK